MISIITCREETSHNKSMKSHGNPKVPHCFPTRVVQRLPPAAFSFVMATGIVSLAARRLQLIWIDQAFFAIAAAGYIVLLSILLLKLAFFTGDVLGDFKNPQKAPGFFTLVAATSVVGVGLIKISSLPQVALNLWYFASILYTFMIYAFLLSLITKTNGEGHLKAVNGTWLLLIVGLQSISVLATTLHESGILLDLQIPISCFLIGISMYMFVLFLVVGRILFLQIEPEQLIPPYWIMMGAAAISTLAGSELTLACRLQSPPISYLPFLEGTTVSIWTVAVSWIPLLLCLGIWRHGFKRVKLTYEVGLWSIVFPLGMLTASSHSLSMSQHLPWLASALPYMFIAAAAAWALVAIGFLLSLIPIRTMKGEPGAGE